MAIGKEYHQTLSKAGYEDKTKHRSYGADYHSYDRGMHTINVRPQESDGHRPWTHEIAGRHYKSGRGENELYDYLKKLHGESLHTQHSEEETDLEMVDEQFSEESLHSTLKKAGYQRYVKHKEFSHYSKGTHAVWTSPKGEWTHRGPVLGDVAYGLGHESLGKHLEKTHSSQHSEEETPELEPGHVTPEQAEEIVKGNPAFFRGPK